MAKGVILVDWTDQGRRTIKDSPDRAEAAKAEATKLGVQVKDLFYTPGGPHDAAIVIEAEGPEPINKLMSSVQSLGNVKMKFIRAFSIEERGRVVQWLHTHDADKGGGVSKPPRKRDAISLRWHPMAEGPAGPGDRQREPQSFDPYQDTGAGASLSDRNDI